MAVGAQLIFLLLCLVSISGSSDVVRSVRDSVQLDIQCPVPKGSDLIWVFNGTYNVLQYFYEFKTTTHYAGYEGRVEFNKGTYSLTLKNLQKTDCGLYEARASGDQVTVVAEYRLSVLDPVKAPVLTAFVHVSRDTCNITLTCSGQDLSINSSCYNEICEEKKETSPGGVTLSLSVNGSAIICNQSNPVSWKENVSEMGELKRLCAAKNPVEDPALSQVNNDTCNVTVTCRGHDLSINSSCSKETCEEKEVTSPRGVTLSLSVRGSSIICNLSNPASWKNRTLEMGELTRSCADENGGSSEDGGNHPVWLWVVAGFLGVIIVVVIILIIGLKFLQKKSTGAIVLTENTVYAEVQHNSDAPQTVMMEHPTTVYSVVGKQQPPPSNEQSGPSPVSQETLPSGQSGVSNTYESVPSEMSSTKPETIYATVSKGIKSS